MKNRAFVKYRKNGEIVPGSLIVTNGGYPKGGPYKEITTDLCCDTTCSNVDLSPWRMVTGGTAGDGVVLRDDNNNEEYTIIGPNDDDSDGWVYITKYFETGTYFEIDYQWTSFDEGIGVDRPVYWTSSTEPTGIPGNTTSQVSTTPDDGIWSFEVGPNEWFAVGIYSTDSCCGRGFLTVDISYP
jgi:hypothetical protein